jgi:hypothetical protein
MSIKANRTHRKSHFGVTSLLPQKSLLLLILQPKQFESNFEKPSKAVRNKKERKGRDIE